MSDPIDRQAALYAIYGICNEPVAWLIRAASEIEKLPSAQPDIIRCKDCKHRPKATRADENVFYGFSVEFPDKKCPCHCEDGWYGWYPDDDFYCGYAERREE